MPKSTASTATGKAKKQHPDWEPPYEDFPLSYHPPSGRLYKTVHRKRIYFGYARNWKEALAEWLRTKDEHLAGRKPRPKSNGKFSLGMLCNRFLTAQHHKLQTGEISPRHFGDCKTTTDRIVKAFGATRAVEDLDSADFAKLRKRLAEGRNAESLGNEINRVRGVFKFAFDNGLISRPVCYGSDFKRPNRRALRKVRNSRPQRFFEAAEIRTMLGSANLQMKAMILLAVNGGLGNSDIANLPLSAIDLQSAWLDFPRPRQR